MCDYSLMHVKSRPAAVADKLVTSGFVASSSKGFRAPDDCETAVCVLPGTEITFEQPIVFKSDEYGMDDYWSMGRATRPAQVAIFRQVNLEHPCMHHDCIELADGERIMLTNIESDIAVTVLQMPAAPKNKREAKEQTRLAVVG
jgi:hypothetical protein